jgi:cation transport ATPase
VTPAIDTDLLTRTTLQVDGSSAGGSLAQMIRALQRVPGVLLAEVNAATARAVVAHDAAVPATSLIAAAEKAGVHVRIIGDTRAPKLADKPGTPLHSLGRRQLLIAAAAAFIVLTIVDLLVPNAAQKHGVLFALTSLLWALFLVKSFIRRRRS